MTRDRLHGLRVRLAYMRGSLNRAQRQLQTERNPEERRALKAKIDALKRGIQVADGLMQEVFRLREKVKG